MKSLIKKEPKAIEIRRGMISEPLVLKSLNKIEQFVFKASTRLQICEIEDRVLVEKIGKMFLFIAKDIGYNIPNEDEWIYTCTRLLDILKKYFSNLTLQDIKLAFELSTTGELDEFFHKDSNGNPDKKHYQQFNVDYLSKILNAYKAKQNSVIVKASNALRTSKAGMTRLEKQFYREQIKQDCKNAYINYKEKQVLPDDATDAMFIFDWLRKLGYVDKIETEEEDRKEAFSIFMQRFAKGFVNKYKAYHVKSEGTKSSEIDYFASEVRRKKEIKKAFDKMIKKGVDINNLI